MKTRRKAPEKKVFISYAREDQAHAEKIYKYLSDADFNPWMDVHDIVSGDDWLMSITRAIKQTDYFLAILSRNSVNKPGVLQEELDIALEICKKIPDPDIFLIPVRLEECKMPERISQYQWVNLFADDGWVRLLRALHQRRQTTRKWDWRLLAPLTGLLLISGFIAWNAAFQPVKPDLALYENACKVSETYLEVGYSELEGCQFNSWETLTDIWKLENIHMSPYNQSVQSTQEAQSLTGYDMLVQGSCTNDEITLQFDLISSRKPDEIYEPSSLQVAGTLIDVGEVGQALFSYQLGDYAEATRRFKALEHGADLPELSILMTNSLMFNGNYEDAISVLEGTVLSQYPEWGAAYNNLGIARFNYGLLGTSSGYVSRGLDEFDQAIKYASAQDDDQILLLAYTNKGDLLRRGGNWEDAEDACRVALRSYSRSSPPYICLTLYKLSRYSGSSEDISFFELQDALNNAKLFGPPPAKFYYLQASLYRMQNQNQDALANYENFLEIMNERACLEIDWRYIKDAAVYIAELQK